MYSSQSSKTKLYGFFCSYFDNIVLKKYKDTETHSVYAVGIKTLLANVHRALLVVVPRDVFFIGHETQLKHLEWTSLQARSLPNALPNIPIRFYRPKQHTPFTEPIRISERGKNFALYSCLFPLSVRILQDDNNVYQSPNEGNLSAAIETFNTIIELI